MTLLPSVRRVLDVIAPELSRDEFRPVNQRYYAVKLGFLQQTVSNALQTLVRDGVLARGPDAGNARTYKLLA